MCKIRNSNPTNICKLIPHYNGSEHQSKALSSNNTDLGTERTSWIIDFKNVLSLHMKNNNIKTLGYLMIIATRK
jgi:hypothetical protein